MQTNMILSDSIQIQIQIKTFLEIDRVNICDMFNK